MRGAALFLAMLAIGAPAAGAEPMIRLQLRGQALEGAPLEWSAQRVFLLARDGALVDFAPGEAQNFRKTAEPFRGFSPAELRGQLLREFGKGFDVSGAGHYLVVHPAGQRDAWASRFEELYRSFVHYFAARGWRPQEPQFPLVAVVMPSQQEFVRAAARDGVQAPPGLLGFYSTNTNRILMFDSTAGRAGGNWSTNAETIIHEAAHQTAFNTGVHGRFGQTPRWIVEGLGTLFEARGVWNSRLHPQRSDRVNRDRLSQFRQLAAQRKPGTLAELVGGDRLFSTNVHQAYADSWALSFFLSETEPSKYLQLLRKTAGRPSFVAYRGPDRLRDFSDIFGSNLALLEARLLRFLSDLK